MPELDVPEAKDIPPLTPSVPAFKVLIVILPLLVAAPFPEIIERAPPVLMAEAAVLVPAVKSTSAPPIPPEPEPADIIMSPPFPPTATPVASVIEPVVPLEDVPEKNEIAPLTPLVPAFDVLILIEPLVVADPWPAVKDIAPPVLDVVVVPAVKETTPPSPTLPLPTLTKISPPLPFVAAPLKSCNEPDVPELVVPDTN